jgi:hypothetical protein
LLKHHEREIISLLKRAYFSNPVDYGRVYSFGEHTASSTLFTGTPEEETGPVLRLFSNTRDEVTKKGSSRITGSATKRQGYFQNKHLKHTLDLSKPVTY